MFYEFLHLYKGEKKSRLQYMRMKSWKHKNIYVHNSVWYLPIYPLYIQEGADQARNAGKEVSETQKLQK